MQGLRLFTMFFPYGYDETSVTLGTHKPGLNPPEAFATDRSKAAIRFFSITMHVSWSCLSFMFYIFRLFNIYMPPPYFPFGLFSLLHLKS